MNSFELPRVNSGSKRVNGMSKRGKINKSFVESLPASPDKPTYWFDDLEPGFGVRVSGNTRTYICQGWLKNAQPPKKIRKTIGRHGRLTAEDARKIAAEYLRDITVLGVEPGVKAASQDKTQITLRQVFEDYASRGDLREKTVSIYRRALEGGQNKDSDSHWIGFSDWLDIPIGTITSQMVRERYRILAQHEGVRSNGGGAKAAAAQAMRVLNTLFNYAINAHTDGQDNPIFAFNPVARLKFTDKKWNEAAARTDDVIAETNLARWYQVVNALGEQGNNRNAFTALTMSTAADAMLLCLFTGLRRTAAFSIKWSNVDWDNRTIVIPASDDKKNKRRTLPMSDFVYDLLQKRKSASVVDRIYVFPGDSPGHPFQEPKRAIAKVVEKSGVKFSMHTLRRTFATTAQKRELQLPYVVVKHLMHHSLGRDVTAINYTHIELEDLREPMQLICDYLCQRLGISKKGAVAPTALRKRAQQKK